jgi:hypothetical protein
VEHKLGLVDILEWCWNNIIRSLKLNDYLSQDDAYLCSGPLVLIIGMSDLDL